MEIREQIRTLPGPKWIQGDEITLIRIHSILNELVLLILNLSLVCCFHQVFQRVQLFSALKKQLAKFAASHKDVAECTYNETLNAYYKRVQGFVVFCYLLKINYYFSKPLLDYKAEDNWDRFYEDIGTCDLYRNDKLIDTLLHDIATMPIKHVGMLTII